MSSPILVAGATGATGRAATEELLRKGLSVRAFVHQYDDRARNLEAQGAEIFVGDLLDFRVVRRAFQGVKRAYFVYPVRPGLVDATTNFAQAAKDAEAEFIVNMSQINALPDASSNASLNHWLAERIFDWAGTPVAHLRVTIFHSWVFLARKMIKEEGSFEVPFGPSGKFASVGTEDLGLLIATILANPSGHAGQTYPVVGNVELTPPEMAEVISKALGREVGYQEVSAAEFIKSFTGQSLPYLEQHFQSLTEMHRRGILGGANDWLEGIIGRRPQSLFDYIQKNRAFWE